MRKEYVDIGDIALFCDITTWIGTSIGAQHYYGKLKYCPDWDRRLEHELSTKLTQRAAIEHNKGLRRFGRPAREYVKAGQITNDFQTKDDVREAAIKVYEAGKMRDRWDEIDIVLPATIFLIEGDTGICQPQRVLACKPGYEDEMRRLNEIFEDGIYEDGTEWYWEKDDEGRLENLSADWYAIMKTVTKKAAVKKARKR